MTPGRGLQKRADWQMPTHVAAELKRDAISFGELQIRDQVSGLGRQLQCTCIPVAVEIREARKISAALRDNGLGCCVGLEDLRFIILIERHQRRHQPSDSRVPGERSVLCLRQLQPRLEADRGGRQTHGAQTVSRGGGNFRLHKRSHYSIIFTMM